MFDQLDYEVEAPQEDKSADALYELTVAEHNRSWPDEARDWIPADLDSMVPDVFLAAILSVADVSRMSGSDVVSVMQAKDRLVSHFRAGVLEAMAETAHCLAADTLDRSEVPTEFASEEIAAALTLSRRKADHDLGMALDLGSDPPGQRGTLPWRDRRPESTNLQRRH